MSLQQRKNAANSNTVPFVFEGLNLATSLGPQVSFSNQMEFYLNSPLDQQVTNTWDFHSLADGRERQWKEADKEDYEVRKKTCHTKLCARGHWRPHEDAYLKELVAQHGPQNWNLIAEKLEGRSGKSCRLRWFNQLDPRINRRAFTQDEEERLLAAHRMYGNKWALIARLFPGRTDNAVKNHWHVIMARKHREENSVYRRRKPSNFQSCSNEVSENTVKNNAWNESNISSNNVDESTSTCTDLSLTPSSTKGLPGFLTSCSSSEGHQLFGLRINHEEMIKTGSVVQGYLLCRKGPVAKAAAQNSSGQSDTNSEVSASESVANTKANLYVKGKFENGSDNSNRNMPFIDFLGVGII